MRTNPVELSIKVPGARLRYFVQGSGPLLVLIAGGHGDASRSAALAAHLADFYTVLTYDRRGLSGSTTDEPARTIEEHGEDVSRLLAAVTAEPAYVFGTSLGAVIALALAVAHPDQVRVVVAHEPGAVDWLPEPARAGAIEDLLGVEEALATDGIHSALQRFAQFADIDPTDREPEVEVSPPNAQQLANLEFYITHDLPAQLNHVPELDKLRDSPVAIISAVSVNTAHIWPHACGRLLAESLGLECAALPGGHNGYIFRPRETAERLHEVFGREATQ